MEEKLDIYFKRLKSGPTIEDIRIPLTHGTRVRYWFYKISRVKGDPRKEIVPRTTGKEFVDPNTDDESLCLYPQFFTIFHFCFLLILKVEITVPSL